MSTRQLRKLQKQRELEAKAGQEYEGSEGDAGDDEIAPVVAKPRANLFAALIGDEAEAEAEDEAEDDDDAEESKELGLDAEVPVEEPAASTAGRKNKKKKKKKKSKKNKPIAPTQDVKDSEDDEIDKAIKELKLESRAQEAPASNDALEYEEIFKIKPYNLKAAHEMRNLFGRDTIELAEAEEEGQRRGARHGVMQQMDLESFLRVMPDARKLPEVSRRRNVFIHGKEHWPMSTTGGLSMKELGKSPDGMGVEYTYVHNAQYDGVQTMFFAQVQMGDPMRMVTLLQRYPYHVSTLLQVSSVAKQDQNMSLAAELCERALFSFGRVALSSFKQNLEQGTARLDFRRPENRQFWLAGYHYIKSLVRKGTYKTALEWAKLLYSLDRNDPYAMRHLIPSLAIRAHEEAWALDFLRLLEPKDQETPYIMQSRVLAELQLGEAEQAREHLVEGLQQLPWLYCALFQELGLDTPPSVWGINADTSTRKFWVKLYLQQVKDLWNVHIAKTLLQDAAKSIGRVDTSSLPLVDWEVGLDVTRLAYIDGQTSLLALASPDILTREPNYEFDPLPPAEIDNIFTGEGCRLPWTEQRNLGWMEQLDVPDLGALLANDGVVLPMTETSSEEEDDDDDYEYESNPLLSTARDAENAAGSGNRRGVIQRLLEMLSLRGRARLAGEDTADTGTEAEREVEERLLEMLSLRSGARPAGEDTADTGIEVEREEGDGGAPDHSDNTALPPAEPGQRE